MAGQIPSARRVARCKRSTRRAISLSLVALGLLAAGSGSTHAADGAFAVPQDGQAAERVRETLQRIRLPEGFSIELFAMAPDARHMAVSPDGHVVFVGTTYENVWAIADKDGDGRADSLVDFAPGLSKRIPNGPCLAPDGTLYLSEQNRITAFLDAARHFSDREIETRTVVSEGDLIPASEESNGHSTRVCRIGPDGKLYVSLGQPYNVTPKGKVARYRELGIGGILRMDTDGRNRAVYASGLRNSVGLDFNPANGELWFTDNQVDRMGDDIPPGEINRQREAGEHFGFPWYGGGAVRTREYAGDAVPVKVTMPAVETVAHAADLGMTFYRGDAFPQRYHGGIFSAQHGSWNRTTPVGAQVLFTPVNADGSAGKPEVFASGWLNGDGDYDGRPVDVAEMPDGSLLVSDDFAGAIYRIRYRP